MKANFIIELEIKEVSGQDIKLTNETIEETENYLRFILGGDSFFINNKQCEITNIDIQKLNIPYLA